MAEKFEFDKSSDRLDSPCNPALVNETIEMSQLPKGGFDSRVNTYQEVIDKSKLVDSFEQALQEAVHTISSISTRVQNLPLSDRETLLGSISGMTGEQYPAYDALRLSLRDK